VSASCERRSGPGRRRSAPRGVARQGALWAGAVVLTVLAFPPHGLWPLTAVMLAPVAAFAERRSARAAFGFTYVYAAGMGLIVVRWLVHALADEYGVAPAAAWTFTVLLVGAYALVPAAAVALHAALRPRVGPVLAPLVFAALWILGEWLRAGPLRLPWLLAAQPLAFVPPAIQSADLGGMHLPGLAVAAVGGGIGIAAARRDVRALLAPALLAVAAGAYGAWRLAPGPAPEGAPELAVAVVQASVPQSERFRPGSAARNTMRHVALTMRLLAGHHADLVVWSETAVDEPLDRAPRLEASLRRLVETTGVPLVTGAPLANRGRPTNSVLLFRPGGGPPDVYDKRRLVPFSEYEPRGLAWLSRLLPEVTAGEGYVPGDGLALLRAGGTALAAPICFEITYPHLLRRFRRAGAQLVLNLSNDAWFGSGGYARLHLAHAVFRAVELRTWVVRATNTGISAVLDPRGRVVAELPLFEAGTLVATVHPTDPPGLYTRWGDGPLLALCVAIPCAALAAARRPARPGGRWRPASRRSASGSRARVGPRG